MQFSRDFHYLRNHLERLIFNIRSIANAEPSRLPSQIQHGALLQGWLRHPHLLLRLRLAAHPVSFYFCRFKLVTGLTRYLRIIAALGGVLYTIRGSTHAFSLSDERISYPFYPDTVSYQLAGLIAFIVPAVLIAALSLLVAPGGSSPSTASLRWRRKLWNWHAGWLGLGLSLAGAFFVTSALKDVIGKPRPNLLARCQPDTSLIDQYIVGGLGQSGVQGAPVLVTVDICGNPNKAVVQDGFSAFPSGHSSFALSGLLYFSLWLCGRFGAAVPAARSTGSWQGGNNASASNALRGAAPPVYLLVAALIPLAGGIYICASRWADNQHEGWDILAGAAIGALFAWLGYRWYHPPLYTLLGASWEPRLESRALYGGLASSEAEEYATRHEEEGGMELGAV